VIDKVDTTLRQKRFLACFEVAASVQLAAKWAGVSRQAHYLWLNEDPDYPERFRLAESRAARALEDEAVRRAKQGTIKAIRYKGRIVGHELEYSDTLMVQLLKANNPKKFLERSTVAHTDGEGGSLISALRSVIQGKD
jgi:hypothetical protein